MGAQDFRNNPRPGYLKKFVHLVLANHQLNMSNWIDRLAGLYGERVVIYLDRPLDYGFFRGTDITYRDALKFVNRIGNALLGLGVRPGDRVAMITTNRIEFAFCCFAVMKIGAIAVPLNAMYRSQEIRYVLENSGAKVLIVDRAVYGAGIQDPARFPSIEKWVMLTREEPPAGFHSLADLMLAAGEELAPLPLPPGQVVGIFYTSGTTGLPKGATLSNEGLARSVRGFARVSAFFPGFLTNRFLGVYVTPLAHIMGYVVIISVFSGGSPSIFKTAFVPSDILRAIQENRATSFVGVPTMYRMLLAAGSDRYDLSSMKLWGSAAEAISRDLILKFRTYGGIRFFGKRILPPVFFEGYGQVETAGIITTRIHPFLGEIKEGCVGKPARGIEVRLLDDEGKKVKRGKPGILWVRGPRVTKGYWNSPEMNARAFQDGWFSTGDYLRRNRKGEFFFVDREKDLIKCGGYSIFSKELEEELLRNEKIAEAAVIGVPDEIKGAKPIAIVRLKPEAEAAPEEILEWARANIAPYKAPRHIELVTEFPLGATMKIDKKELRKRYANLRV